MKLNTMPTYPYQQQLHDKAQQLIEHLAEQQFGQSKIIPTSYREYSVALQIARLGTVTLYYSPKKDRYKLVSNNLDDQIRQTVEQIWQSLPATTVIMPRQVLTAPRTAYQAFVDGSFNEDRHVVGYGAIILHDQQEVIRLSGRAHTPSRSKQIGGELTAVTQVLRWCEEQTIPQIDIYYDYKGIEMWATGKWQAKQALTQAYREDVQSSAVTVFWHKVKSHSGVRWNEIADQLARQGANLD